MAVPFVTRGGNLLPPPPTTAPTTSTALTASLSLTIQVDEHNLDRVMDAYLLLQSFLLRHGKLKPKSQTSSAPTRSPRR